MRQMALCVYTDSSAWEVLRSRSHAGDDDAVVPERIFLDIAVIGRTDGPPQHQFLPAPHAAEVLPHQAPIMDFLADMRTNDGASDAGRTVAGGNARQLKIKAAQIVVPWRALMIRDKVIGYAHVPEEHLRTARPEICGNRQDR